MVRRHALRNALIPVVTLIGLQAPLLIGGAVIIEHIFVIPGMGRCCSTRSASATTRSSPACSWSSACAVMLINLLVDLSYGLLDPQREAPVSAVAAARRCERHGTSAPARCRGVHRRACCATSRSAPPAP